MSQGITWCKLAPRYADSPTEQHIPRSHPSCRLKLDVSRIVRADGDTAIDGVFDPTLDCSGGHVIVSEPETMELRCAEALLMETLPPGRRGKRPDASVSIS